MTIDAIIPARNEGPTVAAVVKAVSGCSYVRQVVVVDDGSTDDTAELARAAGAKVISRRGERGSKAHAMEAGVKASDADALLFCDADCLGLTPAHLDGICRPFADGRCTMSIGWFDYGRLNPLVLRFAPTTGERVVPRWVWDDVPAHKRQGYSIEIMINEVIAEGHHTTVAATMTGVTHRTKRDKFGYLRGMRETWRMLWHLVGLPVRGVVRWRTYWFYLRRLKIDPPVG
ncbi:MAG: glycosyltransferase family 2 protein [Acidimicrobiales bacterium]